MSKDHYFVLDGTTYTYLTAGSYGAVFQSSDKQFLCKVMKQRTDVTPEHCRDVFNSEVEGYKLAMKDPLVRPLVPRFYGVQDKVSIQSKDGSDCSSNYYSQLVFKVEFVEGSFTGINNAPGDEWLRISKLFGNAGIRHVIDSAVILEEERISKVIDFALKEVELWHTQPPLPSWPS